MMMQANHPGLRRIGPSSAVDHHDTMRMRPPSNAMLQAGSAIRYVGVELDSRASGGVNGGAVDSE